MVVNNELFLLKPSDFPGVPVEFSEEARLWWVEQRRRCIEGYWAGGRYMPGNMYFYLNFWNILLNKNKASKAKEKGTPRLWDILWDVFYAWMEARGFCGFEKTPGVAEYEAVLHNPNSRIEDIELAATGVPDPRETLRSSANMGKPKFLFEAKDLMWLGNRGHGKSYVMAGGIIAHEWLFDGLKEYTPMNLVKNASEVVVGAWDSKYSDLTLAKVKFGLDNLPGAIEVGGRLYPSPFSRLATGSFELNGEFKYEYRKKVGDNWKRMGTRSVIKHRSFKNNDYAASGTRPTVMALDEVGLFPNLMEARIHSTDTMMNQQRKFGSCLYTGTGGDMDSGTIPASQLFYSGDNMVQFIDTYENKGKIGLFIPATHGSEDFKDEYGNTREQEAYDHFVKKRENLKNSPNGMEKLDGEKQNQPLVPSEMFLTRSGNIFPRAELQEHLATIEGNDRFANAERVGELLYDKEGNLYFSLLPQSRAIKVFPHNPQKDDTRGAITIWEPPVKVDGEVPWGLYVAGVDPYDHDESGTQSLGSTIIFKKILTAGATSFLPVAEYTGRHEHGAHAYYEQLRRLLLYYGGAQCMHENNLIGLYKYFEQKNSAYLLMDVPEYARESTGSQPNRPKGMHFGPAQIKHGELLVRDYLIEEYAPGKLNLTKILSVPLLKELIMYDKTGNFDRVRAFMSCMYAVQETYMIQAKAVKVKKSLAQDPFFERSYANRNPMKYQQEKWQQIRIL